MGFDIILVRWQKLLRLTFYTGNKKSAENLWQYLQIVKSLYLKIAYVWTGP